MGTLWSLPRPHVLVAENASVDEMRVRLRKYPHAMSYPTAWRMQVIVRLLAAFEPWQLAEMVEMGADLMHGWGTAVKQLWLALARPRSDIPSCLCEYFRDYDAWRSAGQPRVRGLEQLRAILRATYMSLCFALDIVFFVVTDEKPGGDTATVRAAARFLWRAVKTHSNVIALVEGLVKRWENCDERDTGSWFWLVAVLCARPQFVSAWIKYAAFGPATEAFGERVWQRDQALLLCRLAVGHMQHGGWGRRVPAVGAWMRRHKQRST